MDITIYPRFTIIENSIDSIVPPGNNTIIIPTPGLIKRTLYQNNSLAKISKEGNKTILRLDLDTEQEMVFDYKYITRLINGEIIYKFTGSHVVASLMINSEIMEPMSIRNIYIGIGDPTSKGNFLKRVYTGIHDIELYKGRELNINITSMISVEDIIAVDLKSLLCFRYIVVKTKDGDVPYPGRYITDDIMTGDPDQFFYLGPLDYVSVENIGPWKYQITVSINDTLPISVTIPRTNIKDIDLIHNGESLPISSKREDKETIAMFDTDGPGEYIISIY